MRVMSSVLSRPQTYNTAQMRHGLVQGRAAGALHNLSSDAAAIGLIRWAGGIPPLVMLLGCGHMRGCS